MVQKNIYAGFWLRFVAYFLDSIILSVVVTPISLITFPFFLFGSPEQNFIVTLGIVFFNIAITFFYFTLMESSSMQGTLGKMALGLKVVDMKNKRISFARATGRYFGKILSATILYIGFIMVAFTEKKQGLHDLMAETLVVKK